MSRLGESFRIVVLAAALLAGCSMNSSPFSSASRTEFTFLVAAQTWDVNKDGTVTCDEWKQYVTELFNEADADRDGGLTAEEFRSVTRQDKLFEVADLTFFDANSDGKVTLAEFTEKPNPAFAQLDKNRDCQIATDETVRYRGSDDGPKAASKAPDTRQQGGMPGGR